jgi:hypothetical protein
MKYPLQPSTTGSREVEEMIARYVSTKWPVTASNNRPLTAAKDQLM